MINTDEFVHDFLEECRRQLTTVETDLLAIELGGAEIDKGRVDGVLHALHSVAVGAEGLEMLPMGELAHKAEDLVALIRSRRITPSGERISVLLHTIDVLGLLIEDPREGSTQDEVTAVMAQLAQLC